MSEVTEEKKLSTLERLHNRLVKTTKGTHISILSESDIASQRINFPTPSYDLNRILSGSLYKGIPSKTFGMMVGPEASFKSSFMALCAARAQADGYTIIIIDTEGAWTDDFVKRWGLDPAKILYVYTPWIGEICRTLGGIIDDESSKLVIIIDSIGGIEKRKLADDSASSEGPKADQGTLQKEIKRMLKMLLYICKKQDTVALASGHYYGNPSGYGDADQIGGGKFAKLAPDIIVSLKKSKLYENPKGKGAERGTVIGTEIKACTLKNRYFPPFQEATLEIDFHNGINKYAGLVDVMMNLNLISVGGSWFTLPDGNKVQGQNNVLEALKNNEEEYLTRIEEAINKTGYSNINTEVELAQKLKEEEVNESVYEESQQEPEIYSKKRGRKKE